MVSVVVGARVFAAADDTTAVWAFAHDVPAGSVLGADDLTQVRVHFDGAVARGPYLAGSEPSPVGRVVAADVDAGSMVAASLLVADAVQPAELPLAVAAVDLPAGLAVGDHVQVWAVPVGAGERDASLVFDDVRVVSVASGDALAASAEQQVMVALEPGVDLSGPLAALSGARVVLVRVGSR